jgi:phenylacetate-CoA ligase
MQHQNNALLSWPHEVPAPVAHALVDAHFIRAMELGPPVWWQQWQTARLAEMLAWLGTKDWWTVWAASRLGPTSPIETLSGLPIMLRENYRVLIAAHEPEVPEDHGKLSDCSTSGSSGVPVTFWRSEMALRINANHYWADHQRQGRDLTQRMGVLTAGQDPHAGVHRELIGEDWLHPGLQMSRLTTQFTLEQHARWLCDHPVAYLATPPGTLAGMIAMMQELGIQAPKLLQIMPHGQTVSPELRERTRRVLGASIRDRYCCEEVGPVAFQCPDSDDYYHCCVANVGVEVVDEDNRPLAAGMQGTVLVTGLHQWASPAVRYQLGDVASLHAKCPACGATVPTLSQLLGRKHVLLRMKDRTWRYVQPLASDWLQCAAFLEYRLVQTKPFAFRAEFVLDHAISADEVDLLVKMLTKRIGPEFTFELVQLDAIPWPPGRKRQEFVGLMP